MGTALIIYTPPGALVPVSPVRTLYSAGWGAQRILASRARSKLLAAEKAIREYNFLTRQLRREIRQEFDLFGEAQFTLIDSPHIAVKQDPRCVPAYLRDKGPKAPRPTNAELRSEARKNKVHPIQIWDRFPPSTPAEWTERNRELSRFLCPSVPPEEKKKVDLITAFLRSSAKVEAKATGADYRALLSSSEWKAKKTQEYNTLQTLILDIDLGI